MKFSLRRNSADTPGETFGEPSGITSKLTPQLVGLIAVAALLLLGGVYFLLLRGDNSSSTNSTALPGPTLPAVGGASPTQAPTLGDAPGVVADPNATTSNASTSTSSSVGKPPATREPFKELVTPKTSQPGVPVNPTTSPSVPSATLPTATLPTQPTATLPTTSSTSPTPTTPTTAVKKTATFKVVKIDEQGKKVEATLEGRRLILSEGQAELGITLTKIENGQAFFHFGPNSTQETPLAQGAQVELQLVD